MKNFMTTWLHGIIRNSPEMKKEFESCGIARPAVYLVLKGYSMGEKKLETGDIRVTYYSFAIPEETLKKIERTEEKGWKLYDGYRSEFSVEQRRIINSMRDEEEKKDGKEKAQKSVLQFVRKNFFHWDSPSGTKVNYRLSNEEALEIE